MLCREIIAVCSQIHTKHINTLCGQNVEFLNVKLCGTYSSHYYLKNDLYSRSHFSRAIKSSRNEMSGQVAHTGDIRGA